MPKEKNNKAMKQSNNKAVSPPREEHHHTKEVALILVALVLLVLIGAGWWYFGGRTPAETTHEISPGVERRSVDRGIISGFPASLIQEENVLVDGSYAIDYLDNNQSQPVVRYTSDLSMVENVERYGQYLDDNGWLFTHTALPQATTETFYYADRGSEEVNVMFIQNEDGTVEVNIAYLRRG